MVAAVMVKLLLYKSKHELNSSAVFFSKDDMLIYFQRIETRHEKLKERFQARLKTWTLDIPDWVFDLFKT